MKWRTGKIKEQMKEFEILLIPLEHIVYIGFIIVYNDSMETQLFRIRSVGKLHYIRQFELTLGNATVEGVDHRFYFGLKMTYYQKQKGILHRDDLLWIIQTIPYSKLAISPYTYSKWKQLGHL